MKTSTFKVAGFFISTIQQSSGVYDVKHLCLLKCSEIGDMLVGSFLNNLWPIALILNKLDAQSAVLSGF